MEPILIVIGIIIVATIMIYIRFIIDLFLVPVSSAIVFGLIFGSFWGSTAGIIFAVIGFFGGLWSVWDKFKYDTDRE